MAFNLLPVVFVVLATWLVHSSLLLGSAAVVGRVYRNLSPRLTEWMWKSAMVLPCLTTAIQCSQAQAFALWRWELASSPVGEPPRETDEEPAFSPEPKTPPAHSPIPAKPAIDWQIEIIPETSPAIAEKPREHLREQVIREAPPLVFPLPEPKNQVSVATEPTNPQITPEETQNPLLQIAEPPPAPVAVKVHPEPVKGPPWFVSVGLGMVFLLGLIGGGRLIGVLVKTRSVMARARLLPSGLAFRELQRLLTRCGKPITIQLYESDAISIPAAGGLFRRRIFLPRDIESRFDREELRALLAHELGHHVRGDVWWLWMGRVACHFLPWQPLLFLAVRRWQQAAEPLCDDWAIARNINPVTLAKSLTQVAQCHLAQPVIGPAATRGPSQLTYRVKRLLETQSDPHPNRRLLGAITLLVAGGVIIGTPAILLPSEEQPVEVKIADPEPNPKINSEDTTQSVPNSAAPSPAPEASPTKMPSRPSDSTRSATSLPSDVRRELDATTADLERLLRLLQEHDDDPELQRAADQLKRRLKHLRSHDLINRNPGTRQTEM